MSYLSVLPLATMKTYLRIDDSQNETDAEITSMIKSALSYIEKHTNIILYQRSKTYNITNNRWINIYDYPINSVTKGIDDDGVDVTLTYKSNYYYQDKNNYRHFYDIDGDAVKLVLSVGYTDSGDVSSELIDVAKVLVKLMYFEQEEDKSFNEMIPRWAKNVLESNRRHVI